MTADTNAVTPFTLSRTMDAPRDQVWRAFTELDHLENWWGPTGFEIQSARLDLRPGGLFVYAMVANGYAMWGRFVYRDIEPQSRIVFVNSFSDADGGLTRAPFADAWPLQTLNTWTFTEVDGKTLIDVHGQPIDASEAEIAVFIAGFDSMRMGFGGTFDKLDAYLSLMS